MEAMLSSAEIAEALGVSIKTVRSWRGRAWRILHPGEPEFPNSVARGYYRPRDVAAWCKAVGREYPKAWEKA